MTVLCDVFNSNYETTLNTILKNAGSIGMRSSVEKGEYDTTIELKDKKLPETLLIEINESGNTLRASYKEKPKLSLKDKARNVIRHLNPRKPYEYQDIEHPNTNLSVEGEKFLDYMRKVLDGLERNHMTTVWGGGD
jgi:hypothetical protein